MDRVGEDAEPQKEVKFAAPVEDRVVGRGRKKSASLRLGVLEPFEPYVFLRGLFLLLVCSNHRALCVDLYSEGKNEKT